jgi:hypothetical protein
VNWIDADAEAKMLLSEGTSSWLCQTSNNKVNVNLSIPLSYPLVLCCNTVYRSLVGYGYGSRAANSSSLPRWASSPGSQRQVLHSPNPCSSLT